MLPKGEVAWAEYVKSCKAMAGTEQQKGIARAVNSIGESIDFLTRILTEALKAQLPELQRNIPALENAIKILF